VAGDDDSPVPAHNMFGSLAATASEPMDATASESKMGSSGSRRPALENAAGRRATYQIFGLPALRRSRAALPSGPMYLYLSCPYKSD